MISAGATSSTAAHGRDWHVGADIYAEEDFFAFAAHDAASAVAASAAAAIGSSAAAAATTNRLHDVCVVAMRQHVNSDDDESKACAAAGAAAARYCSAEAWSSSNVNLHEAEAACTHAVGAMAYAGIDDAMSQPAVCGHSSSSLLSSAAGECVNAALKELSCSAGCAASLTSLPKVGRCRLTPD